MNYPLLIFCLVLLIGLTLSITKDKEEMASLNYIDHNCFGGCLNLVIFGAGSIGCLYHIIRYSITDCWWAFLLLIPLYVVAGFISSMISTFLLDNVHADGYDDATTRVGVRRQIAALLIIIAYIVYYAFC